MGTSRINVTMLAAGPKGEAGTNGTTPSAATFTTSGIVKQTVYNVRDYLAVGDGVTDDTAAIQAATNAATAGGVVYFPAGSYLLTTKVRVPYSGTTLAGAGVGVSILKAAFDSGALFANPGMFLFQSNSGSTPVNNSLVKDLSFDLNHYTASGLTWWGCGSTSTISTGFTVERVDFYNRAPDNSGNIAPIALHGDYSNIPGKLQNLTLRDVYIHDADATTSGNQSGISILLTSSSLSHVLLDNVRLNNVYGTGIMLVATAPSTRYNWKFVNCDFTTCVQNYFSTGLSIITDISRAGIIDFQILGCTFDHTALTWSFAQDVADISIYNGANTIVSGNVFKNTRKVWNPGFSVPRGSEDIGLQFTNNIVYKAIEFQDPDGNFAARYSDNIFYQISRGSFLGGYGRHRSTVISDNFIYNCCRTPSTSSPEVQAIFNLQEGGHIVEGNTIYNDSPQSAPSAPTVATGAAGVLTGTYLYKVTFVIQDFGESTGGTTSASVSPSSQKVSLSNIPLGVQGCTSRNIYRTLAGGVDGTQKLVATINDNTTTTYTDNIADGSLGVAVPTSNTTTNGMLYVFTEQASGGITDTPNVYKNNTILGAGASTASFYLDAGFSHVISGNTGLTEATIVNSQTNDVAGVTSLPATDIVFGNFQASGSSVRNPAKALSPKITTITSSATPTFNTDTCDAVTITALATAITSMTSGLSGTPNNFDKLVVRIKDNGSARAITWGASFEAKGVTLPTTTVISKVLTVGFIYDSVTSKWGCVASAQEV